MAKSKYLASLSQEKLSELRARLQERQGGLCFICGQAVDLHLHKGELDIDHIDPQAHQGVDAEQNFALTHSSCNRRKGTSNLEVARRLVAFENLQEEARSLGERGANLGHVLAAYGGSKANLRILVHEQSAKFSLPYVGQNQIQELPVYVDRLSGMSSVFAVLPVEYLHHDYRINPRTIGSSIRGLIEEFQKQRPQLHIALGWWTANGDDEGPVQVFDGQHKAAAQVLLGAKALPVRIFLNPDPDVLLQANTNAGGKLKQVAFDAAVMHHLGSSLYAERVAQYKKMRDLPDDDFSFSESDLVGFFKGEQREMRKHILDYQKDAIIRHADNRLRGFVNWSGKGSDLPLSYSAIDRTFFKVFLGKQALDTPIGSGMAEGENPRQIEREQLVKLMGLWADTFLVDQWDPDVGGRRIEERVSKDEAIPSGHLRAWRVSREEVLENLLRWVRMVMMNYYAFVGKMVEEESVLQTPAADELWTRVETFLQQLRGLPCWVDSQLSQTVFGPKQPLAYWKTILDTGEAPNGVKVLSKGLDLYQMIHPTGS